MKSLGTWFNEYGESHQNKTNKMVHWVCVPLIMFSIIGLVSLIPFPMNNTSINWAAFALLGVLLFYLNHSRNIFIGMLLFTTLLYALTLLVNQYAAQAAYIYLSIFAAAWVGQFWGHKIEGKKPSFLKDIQFLLIGPAWLMHFVFQKFKIPF